MLLLLLLRLLLVGVLLILHTFFSSLCCSNQLISWKWTKTYCQAIDFLRCCTSNFANKSWNTDLNHSSLHWIRSLRHLKFGIQLKNSQKCLRIPNIVSNFLWIFIIVNKNKFLFIWKVISTTWNYNNWLETISMRMNINVR